MVFGKEIPTLNTKRQLTGVRNMDGVLAMESTDLDHTMSTSEESIMEEGEEEGEGDDEDMVDTQSQSGLNSQPIQNTSKETSKNGRSLSQPSVPPGRVRFLHLFDEKLLVEKDFKELNKMGLQIRCMECVVDECVASIYHHTREVHSETLCVYCLATFQHCRQLQVHLLREHRIPVTSYCNIVDLQKVYQHNEVDLCCADCDSVIEMTGNPRDDAVAIEKHECDTESVICMKCAHCVPLKKMVNHSKTCQGQMTKVINPRTKMPVFMIMRETEHIDLTSSGDESTEKPKPVVAKTAPVKSPQETSRLRSRDNRCKTCGEVIPASKAAQHALQCGNGGVGTRKFASKPVHLSPDITVSKIAVPSLNKVSPTRIVFRKSSPAKVTINGVGPGDVSEMTEDDEPLCSVPNAHAVSSNDDLSEKKLGGVADFPVEPIKTEQREKTECPDSYDTTKETVVTECDKPAIMEVEKKVAPRYVTFEDAILNETDPRRRLSILCEELLKDLDEKRAVAFSTDPNIDRGTRLIVLEKPLDQLSGDEVLEMMTQESASCAYCRQVKLIGVDRRQLAVHLLSCHLFDISVGSRLKENSNEECVETKDSEDVDSNSAVSAGQLSPIPVPSWQEFGRNLLEKIFQLTDHVFNHPSRGKLGEAACECLVCGHNIATQKTLFVHWTKYHPEKAMKCFMCHEEFLFVGALYTHLCFGTPKPVISIGGEIEPEGKPVVGRTTMLRYQCDLCSINMLPGFFNLQVHFRSDHFVCELCLQEFTNHKAVMKHITSKHKLGYYCWCCGFSYADSEAFKQHNSWKHGNCSKTCKLCGQKKWVFSYHNCTPSRKFHCDICQESFSTNMAFRIHCRIHTGEKLRKCTYSGCTLKFISKKLMEKHVQAVHENPLPMTVVNENGEDGGENQQTDDVIGGSESQDGVVETGDKLPQPNALGIDPSVDLTVDDDMEPASASRKAEEGIDADQIADDRFAGVSNREEVNIIAGTAESHSPIGEESAVMPKMKISKIMDGSYQDAVVGNLSPTEDGASPYYGVVGVPNGDSHLDSGFINSNHVSTSPESNIILNHELNSMSKFCENEDETPMDCDKPFDISEFRGPNLSEEESDGEPPIAPKRPKTQSSIDLFDDGLEADHDKGFSLSDLNGHENFLNRIPSPDMANYAHLMDDADNCDDTDAIKLVDDSLSMDFSSLNDDIDSTQNSTTENKQLRDKESCNEKPISVAASSTPEDVENNGSLGKEADSCMTVSENSISLPSGAIISENGLLLHSLKDNALDEKMGADNEDVSVSAVPVGSPQDVRIQPNVSEQASRTELKSNLHDDLQLSSDSSDDEESEDQTQKTSCQLDATNDDDLALQYTTINEQAELPEHIMYARQLRGINNDHTYHARSPSSNPNLIEKDPCGGSVVEMAHESSQESFHQDPPKHREVSFSQEDSFQVHESSHSRKRARSSSTSSSSTSSSSGSSSDTSSSSDSDSEEVEDETQETPQHSSNSINIKLQWDEKMKLLVHSGSSDTNKRGRGRPKGSVNRDKYGVPTAKKFQTQRNSGTSSSRKSGSAPRRKYGKKKGKAAKSKDKDKHHDDKANNPTIAESDLETDDSGSEYQFHQMQLHQPVNPVPEFDKIWTMSGEAYLLVLLRGVDSIDALRSKVERDNEEKKIKEEKQRFGRRVESGGRRRGVNNKDPYVSLTPLPPTYGERIPDPSPNDTSSFTVSPRGSSKGRAKVKIGTGRKGRGQGRGRGRVDNRSIDSSKYVASSIARKKPKAEVEDKNALWCICQQRNDPMRPMVGCGYDTCPYVWFHYDCVGLSPMDIPDGEYYCGTAACLKSRTQVNSKRKRHQGQMVGQFSR